VATAIDSDELVVDETPVKGRGLDELTLAGIATPFVAEQIGTPSADGHIGFRATLLPPDEAIDRSRAFHALMALRRSVRFFRDSPLPHEVLERCIAAATTAPSGAHCQPWTFVIVRDKAVRKAIRDAVEAEETINYKRRMKKAWVKDVQDLVSHLHTGDSISKPYIETAPELVVLMEQPFGRNPDGTKKTHYYPKESTGIAAGIFIAALTNAGLFTLTSTPMGAEPSIRESLGRPSHERVYLLMPVGYPAKDATVPYRSATELRKPLSETAWVV
jgi:iodotyrosine deiodinase